MNDSLILLELQYLPCVEWMRLFFGGKQVIVEQHEHYQKGSYRNRCHIAGPNGLQRLSIPLEKGKHQKMPIREVRISYRQDWVKEHIGSLQAAYGKAPFFPFYHDRIFEQLRRRHEFLFDLNLALLDLLLAELGAEGSVYRLSGHYQRKTGGETLDLRGRIRPGTVPAAASFSYRYPQVFQEKHGFLPGLSVVDLLFCLGPEAGLLLKRSD